MSRYLQPCQSPKSILQFLTLNSGQFFAPNSFMPSPINRPILIGATVVALLALSLVYKQYAGYDDELNWYTASLDYDFSLHVDSIKTYDEKGTGFLYCSLTSGRLNYSREDSLDTHLTAYKRLRLLHFEKERIKVFSGTAKAFQTGDSIYVNSGENTFTISRAGRTIRRYTVRDMLSKRYL